MPAWPKVTPGASTLFGVYLDMAYNVASANLSSPQTTELFASARSDTLWKHVKRADLQVGIYTVLGAIIANGENRGSWVWPVFGGTLAGLIMHGSYAIALRDGLASTGGGPASVKMAWW